MRVSGPRWPDAHWSRLTLVLGFAALLCSCQLMDRMTGKSAAAAKQANDLQELQLKVMRFADEYAGGVIEPTQNFQMSINDPDGRLAAQYWKTSQATAAYTIGSGPNAVTNALDMVVLASLSRMVLEDAWVGERFGERAIPLRDAHRRLERRAWDLIESILSAQNIDQLHRVIDEWRARNPNIRAVSYVHFRDFAKSIGRPGPGESEAKGGLFQLLGLDPLSNLDPAVREITQTRQLAERTIYYMQRVPNLLDMQVQLLTYQVVAMPETRRVLTDVDQFGGAAVAASQLADQLPSIVTREREAAIKQFMDAINTQSAQMRGLLSEMRAALDAGTGASDSVNETIRSLDQLMARFDKPKPPGTPAAPPGRPFDITEYTAAAAEFSRTVNQLQQLIVGIEHGTPALSQSAANAAAQLQNVVDHILWRLLLIGVLLLAAGLGTALAYRIIRKRWLA